MKFTEIYTAREDLFISWMEALKPIVIQTDFHTNYNVIKMLGKGSFARVYLAQSLVTGEQFAVKAFSKEYIESQENGKESLIIELEILRELNHPNVIKFFEIHETQNSLYLVMEVLEGGEIFDLADGKLSPEDAYEITKSLLNGLEYLDSKGIIHRDLKPDNIILKFKNKCLKENVIKIVDFGLSSFIDVEEYLFKRCGTPGFVAPEVINADKTDPNLKFSSKCDVFSVGIIFYFMLTGKIPYDGESFHDVLANNKKASIDFKLPYLNKIDPVALDLLKRMLEIDVNKRFTARDCLDHPYFDEDCEHSEIRRDSVNFNENINLFKEKYRNVKRSNFKDSIKFNAKPDQNCQYDSFNTASPEMGVRSRIDSLKGCNSPAKSKRNSIYKQALMGICRPRMNSSSTRSRDTSIDSKESHNEDFTNSPKMKRVSKFGQNNGQ
jgi:calcium-dependent protein kinase